MSFLAPLFLAGGLAIGLPILFHLIRQTSREKQVFSSLMFLAPTPPRLTRRSRIEHLLLLALRCAAILLLAFGFARPFIKKATVVSPESESAKRVMVLLDSTASMRRSGVWEQAKQEAADSIRSVGTADEVSIYTFHRRLVPVMTFEEWNAAAPGERVTLAIARIAELKPTFFGTRAGALVSASAEILSDVRTNSGSRIKELIVISDMQEGNRWDELQGFEWPRGTSVQVRPVSGGRTSNASLQLLADSGEPEGKSPLGVRIRIQNAADSAKDRFRMVWASGTRIVGTPHDLQVPAGQSRTVTMLAPNPETKADRVQLSGDDEAYDNLVFVAAPPIAKLKVLYFGSDDGSDPRQPLYFIRRAFQDTRNLSVEVVSRKEASTNIADSLKEAALLIVAGPAASQDVLAIREQILSGKTAMAAIHDATMLETIRQLLVAPQLEVHPLTSVAYALMVDLDYKHPLFAPFADPRFADFTRIRFWKPWKINASEIEGARVLAKFDTGTPALLEVPIGKGRVLLWAAGWRPEDSQLALSTKFVPLLYTVLEQSGAPPEAPAQYFAGDAAIPPLAGASTNDPAGVEPGLYQLAGTDASVRVAVNLEPAESRTAPVTIDELERLGVPVKASIQLANTRAAAQVRLANTQLENQQKIWRWIILATICVLFVEIWLSGRASRRIVPATAGG